VRWHGGLGAQARARARGREQSPEAPVCRPRAGELGDEGPDRKKVVAPAQKREVVRFLVETHRLPLRRSCACVGLSRSAWYAPPLDWTVRDAELIAALSEAVRERPSRGFWKCSDLLRRRRPDWNPKRIYRVYKAMKL